MDFLHTAIDALYKDAESKGLTMREACRLANIHPTTPSRWRAGVSPRMKEFQRLYIAINKYKDKKNGKK